MACTVLGYADHCRKFWQFLIGSVDHGAFCVSISLCFM